jgi:hypothetical protein
MGFHASSGMAAMRSWWPFCNRTEIEKRALWAWQAATTFSA